MNIKKLASTRLTPQRVSANPLYVMIFIIQSIACRHRGGAQAVKDAMAAYTGSVSVLKTNIDNALNAITEAIYIACIYDKFICITYVFYIVCVHIKYCRR